MLDNILGLSVVASGLAWLLWGSYGRMSAHLTALAAAFDSVASVDQE